MGNPSRPPCPKCGFTRMWKIHRRGGLKCPKCKHRAKIDDPRLVLRSDSNLADLRIQFGGGFLK